MFLDENVALKDVLPLYKNHDYLLPPAPTKDIKGVSTADHPQAHTLLFFNIYDPACSKKISSIRDCLILVQKDFRNEIASGESVIVFCDNPRYEYARTVQYILDRFHSPVSDLMCSDGAMISARAEIGEGTAVSPFVTIYHEVKIGKNCRIMHGAVINPGSVIGDHCVIRENAVIGSCGFGIEKDSEGNNITIPHIGGVRIGDHVDIGVNSVVCSGTIYPTIVEHHSKIDNFCHIAHNDVIGENTIMTAGVIVGGSTHIGKDCWIGVNSSIVNGVTIGEHTMIGMGANVCRGVDKEQYVVPEKSNSVPRRK